MSQKRLETVGGTFATYDRKDLRKCNRAALKSYLESRGFAVYSHEKTSELRECALADFDGEKTA